MTELWAPISGFEGYEVSSEGRIRNLGGQIVRAGQRGGVRAVKARVLKPFVVKSTGYMQVLLPDRRKHSVHRLVAAAFCTGEAPGLVVDHINNVRADNRAVNLRWVTHAENISRPYREDGKRSASFGKFSTEAPKTTAIVATNIKTGEVREFACASDAVREMGFDSGGISKCCHGKQPYHAGWTFRFADGVRGFPHRKSRTSLGREVPEEAFV